ncbi:LysR family transcriptional regulator [Roseateles depolymerans]|uniref:Putative LysR family transcriptional regulator n=1 Tax=Roseateles depolymerans TaxID=76731 RepID=A0A0U3MYN0_9BURK|nr:LysR family transcriptional regulator [Roseateles depolymerans]ALV06980.1 Putative LysR family transcriptional regulator [Roseateles depolymerans]REG19961.1 LysR family transcriptional regulator [Roseateles depolymerans]
MDTNRLDLNLLVTLEALLTERNVTRAAARLHLSQPAVSAQLNRLRDVFDDPLLLPAQRGMTPTTKALEILEPLRAALDQVRGAVTSHLEFDPSTASLVVTMAGSDYMQTAVVQPLVLRLRKRAPGLRVAVRHLDPHQIDAQLSRGDVDVGLLMPSEAPPSARQRHLFHERYVLIARRDHPGVQGTLTARQFAKLEQVIVSPSGGAFSSPVDQALAARGLKRTVVLSAASFLFVPDIVMKSDLVALVPERLVKGRSSRLQVLECPVPIEGFEMAMVWHERNHGHVAQRWVREEILALVG